MAQGPYLGWPIDYKGGFPTGDGRLAVLADGGGKLQPLLAAERRARLPAKFDGSWKNCNEECPNEALQQPAPAACEAE